MRSFSLVIAILCAISTPFVLNPRQTPAWITIEQIISAILVWPIFIASIALIIYSLVHIRQWKYSLEFIAISVASLVFPGTLLTGSVIHEVGSRLAQEEAARREEWFQYGSALNPLIVQYILDNPDRIEFPFGDDRAQIEGLADFLTDRTSIPIEDDQIIDPWGEPVLIIVDGNNDMKLQFEDNFYGVYNRKGNTIALSLFATKQHSLSRSANERWQIDGGVIQNKKP